MPAFLDELLSRLGADRCGLVTAAQLQAAGVPRSTPSRQVRAGRWQRLAPGVYLPHARPPDVYERAHAASLHAGPDAVITGRAGCLLRSVSGIQLAEGAVTVLVPLSSQVRSFGCLKVVRVRTLPPSQLLRRHGHADLAVADVARCVADAIRDDEDLADARATAVVALRDRAVEWQEVVRQASRPGPGAGHFSRVVQDVADGIRSPAEGDLHDVLRGACRRRRLPPYLLNPDVYVDGVLLGSPDAWFVGLGLGHEQDSREWHGSEHELDATLRRHEQFRRAGLQLHHTTPARFSRYADDNVAELARLVVERQQLARPEPPGLVVLARGPLQPARTPWPQVEPSRWR